MSYPQYADLSSFTPDQQRALLDLTAQLLGYLSTQHKNDGSHSTLTADTITDAGDLTAAGDLIVKSSSPGGSNLIGQKAVLGSPQVSYISVGGGKSLNGLLIGGTAYGWGLSVNAAASPALSVSQLELFSMERGESFARLFYNPLTSDYCLAPQVPYGLDLGVNSSGQRVSVYADVVKSFTGYYERARTVAAGAWTSIAYAGANYTADVGTWTVEAGDQATLKYTLLGKTATLVWVIQTSTLSSTPGVLRIALPVTPAVGTLSPCIVQNASNTVGMSRVIAADAGLYIYKDVSGSAYVAETNTMQTFGELTFEIQ